MTTDNGFLQFCCLKQGNHTSRLNRSNVGHTQMEITNEMVMRMTRRDQPWDADYLNENYSKQALLTLIPEEDGTITVHPVSSWD
ncbi:hypothetical protein STEG23_007383 [Scotinomys teguina]